MYVVERELFFSHFLFGLPGVVSRRSRGVSKTLYRRTFFFAGTYSLAWTTDDDEGRIERWSVGGSDGNDGIPRPFCPLPPPLTTRPNPYQSSNLPPSVFPLRASLIAAVALGRLVPHLASPRLCHAAPSFRLSSLPAIPLYRPIRAAPRPRASPSFRATPSTNRHPRGTQDEGVR